MEHRLRRKQLNSDTNASNKEYLKEIPKKEKKKLFLRKKYKKKMKNIKKSKNEEMNKKLIKNEKNKKQEKKTKKNGRKKKLEKKEKRAPRGVQYTPRWAQKLIFHMRTVKRSRNEIEAQKKSDFEHPTKTKKMKKSERK